MMKLLPFLLLLVLLLSTTMAQDSYTFMADRYFSSSVGAENLLTIHKLSYTLENKFLNASFVDEASVSGKALGISYRLGKTILLDDLIDDYAVLLQHEVFGHGARAREYRFSNVTYSISPPFPYGTGTGVTWWNYPPEEPFSLDKDLSITYAGVEATTLLSKRLLFNWLERGNINYRETLLYNRASLGLTGYLWLTKLGRMSVDGNDMLQYEMQLNQREGYFNPSEYRLTVNDLAKQTLIVGLDPFQYFSLYAFLKSYLYSAEESFEFPMIPIGKFKYLPSFRFGLTPFGSEIYLDHFLVGSKKVMNIYFRYGIPTFHRSWGLGFYGMTLFQAGPVSFDAGFDIWNQPAIDIEGPAISESRSGLGGAMSCRIFLKFVKAHPALSFVGEMKAKTLGYLPGEPLRDALVLRAGLSLAPR